EKMFQMARQAMQNAYVPYSNFKVGACLRTADDQLFSGCNIENVSYGLTQCAEASALGAMIAQQGKQQFKEIAIVSSGTQVIYPCGACRQRLAEFSVRDTVFYLQGEAGQIVKRTLAELLPYSFNPTHLGIL